MGSPSDPPSVGSTKATKDASSPSALLVVLDSVVPSVVEVVSSVDPVLERPDVLAPVEFCEPVDVLVAPEVPELVVSSTGEGGSSSAPVLCGVASPVSEVEVGELGPCVESLELSPEVQPASSGSQASEVRATLATIKRLACIPGRCPFAAADASPESSRIGLARRAPMRLLAHGLQAPL